MHLCFWPNFPKAKFLENLAIVNSVKAEGYKTDPRFWLNIPKAKTNPNEAKFLGDWAIVSFVKAEVYETDLDFWAKNPKALYVPPMGDL